jgi:hypothetical protein
MEGVDDVKKRITDMFAGLAGGAKEAGLNKAMEYAKRIMSGEPKEKVLEGIGPVFRKSVDQAINQLTAAQKSQPQAKAQPQKLTSQQIFDWAKGGDKRLQIAVARIVSGDDRNQIKTLHNAIAGDEQSRKWLTDYVSAMGESPQKSAIPIRKEGLTFAERIRLVLEELE